MVSERDDEGVIDGSDKRDQIKVQSVTLFFLSVYLVFRG
jgi:hypothetical protein